ncbi:hypothetical protein NCC49_000675 [Naganishia albida]|nr:hypothetical protein NCC49_000675 [Naganishia albida]
MSSKVQRQASRPSGTIGLFGKVIHQPRLDGINHYFKLHPRVDNGLLTFKFATVYMGEKIIEQKHTDALFATGYQFDKGTTALLKSDNPKIRTGATILEWAKFAAKNLTFEQTELWIGSWYAGYPHKKIRDLDLSGLPPLPDNRDQVPRGSTAAVPAPASTMLENDQPLETMIWESSETGSMILDLSALGPLFEIEIEMPSGRTLRYNGNEFEDY